jgi:Icc-related predicted phosphoesterase
MTAGGTMPELDIFAYELRSNPDVEHILLVPGNHDRQFQQKLYRAKELFDDRVKILIDEGVTIGGKMFYGSPWTPPFMKWWFMAHEQELEILYRAMPTEIDVLITHGPPYSVLDPGHDKKSAGSRALALAITRRKIAHHIFGHLHSAGGRFEMVDDTMFYNVAACDEAYKRVNEPLVLNL